jgi:UDP-3-O-[3-hydroxymyristoyl] glucosamine N-acyltransferase
LTLTRPTDLLALNRHYLGGDRCSTRVEAMVPDDATIVPPVCIEAGVGLGRSCRIGPEVFLETGCRIGDGASVQQAVLLRGAEIGAQAVVKDVVVG